MAEQIAVERFTEERFALHDADDGTSTFLCGCSSRDGENDPGGACSILVDTAYHLGEIRQALCMVKR